MRRANSTALVDGGRVPIRALRFRASVNQFNTTSGITNSPNSEANSLTNTSGRLPGAGQCRRFPVQCSYTYLHFFTSAAGAGSFYRLRRWAVNSNSSAAPPVIESVDGSGTEELTGSAVSRR